MPQIDREGAIPSGSESNCQNKVKIWAVPSVGSYQLNWMANYCWPAGDTEDQNTILNPYGFADLYGNVAEWVHDSYVANLPTTPITNPVYQTSTNNRILRGGSYLSTPELLRSASRVSESSTTTSSENGFRVVRSISSP